MRSTMKKEKHSEVKNSEIKYFTSKFEFVGTISNSLWLSRKIKAILSNRFEPENKFKFFLNSSKNKKYYFLTCVSILLKILYSFKSKYLYEAIIILIYNFLIITNIKLSIIEMAYNRNIIKNIEDKLLKIFTHCIL